MKKKNGKLCATYKSVTEQKRLNTNNFITHNVFINSFLLLYLMGLIDYRFFPIKETVNNIAYADHLTLK